MNDEKQKQVTPKKSPLALRIRNGNTSPVLRKANQRTSPHKTPIKNFSSKSPSKNKKNKTDIDLENAFKEYIQSIRRIGTDHEGKLDKSSFQEQYPLLFRSSLKMKAERLLKHYLLEQEKSFYEHIQHYTLKNFQRLLLERYPILLARFQGAVIKLLKNPIQENENSLSEIYKEIDTKVLSGWKKLGADERVSFNYLIFDMAARNILQLAHVSNIFERQSYFMSSLHHKNLTLENVDESKLLLSNISLRQVTMLQFYTALGLVAQEKYPLLITQVDHRDNLIKMIRKLQSQFSHGSQEILVLAALIEDIEKFYEKRSFCNYCELLNFVEKKQIIIDQIIEFLKSQLKKSSDEQKQLINTMIQNTQNIKFSEILNSKAIYLYNLIDQCEKYLANQKNRKFLNKENKKVKALLDILYRKLQNPDENTNIDKILNKKVIQVFNSIDQLESHAKTYENNHPEDYRSVTELAQSMREKTFGWIVKNIADNDKIAASINSNISTKNLKSQFNSLIDEKKNVINKYRGIEVIVEFIVNIIDSLVFLSNGISKTSIFSPQRQFLLTTTTRMANVCANSADELETLTSNKPSLSISQTPNPS